MVLEGRDQWGGSSFIMTGPDDDRGEDLTVLGANEADLEFIAHARQDIPRMLSEIERLRGRARRRAFEEFVASRGVSLESLGLRERALLRDDALQAVDLAESAGAVILGGDVWVDKMGRLEPDYANWHTDQREEEAATAFAARSCKESRAYIAAYPEPPDGVPLFVLVTSDEDGSYKDPDPS
jgi:hypothetical protein